MKQGRSSSGICAIRSARFRCAIALATPEGTVWLAEGSVQGRPSAGTRAHVEALLPRLVGDLDVESLAALVSVHGACTATGCEGPTVASTGTGGHTYSSVRGDIAATANTGGIKLDGVEGALVAWISDAICERDRAEPGRSPGQILARSKQRDVMAVFDALIANVDRNLGNRLTSPLDGKLHLIDHSRSFRLDRKPSKEFLDSPSSLPRALHDRLATLDRKALSERLGGLVTKQQVKALLARRDAIVAKVEKDRRLLGDAMVFHESAPPIEEAR